MTENGENQRDPQSHGRRDSDAIGVEFDIFAQRQENRLAGFVKKGLIAFGIIGLACTVALFGFGVALNAQQHTQDQLKELVKQQKKTSSDIQAQRKDSLRTSCTDQNTRHDGAITALKAGSDIDQENAPNDAARKEIRRRRDVTIALLDALAPHQDCEKLIKRSVKPTGG